MNPQPLIVGIGGTTRVGSTSERELRMTLAAAQALGARTRVFGGAELQLPHYDPATAARGPRETELVQALREADGVIIASPSYHGSISGLLKNALDYIEDLRTDSRVYLESRAVGCIVCAEGPQAMGATVAALRAIVHSLRGWPTPYAAMVHTNGPAFDSGPQGPDPAVVQQLELVAAQVIEFVKMRRALVAASS